MKYVISFFVLLTTSVSANPIQIFYEENPELLTSSVKEILVKNYQIPEELISIIQITRCENLRKKGKLDLCLKKNGDLLLVSVDDEFISESLKIFQAP